MLKDNLFFYKGKELTYDELPRRDYSFKIDVICDKCSKEFKSCKHLLIKNGHQMCKDCAIKENRRKPYGVGDKVNEFTVLKVYNDEILSYKLLCSCGNIVYKTQRELQTTCKSCGCIQKERARENLEDCHKFGEESSHWKGGVSFRDKPERRRIDYKHFRKACVERDNYTCQLCGKYLLKDLNVHHLDCLMDSPEKMYDINNGISLCRNCHMLFHKECGRKHTTKEQFFNWMALKKEYSDCFLLDAT